MTLDPAYATGGIEEAPDDGQQYTRGNTAWDPSLSGVIISANLTLDGTEVSSNFVLVASATRTLTLPLASTVPADYLLSLANRSDKKNTKWLIAAQGGDTINGLTSFSLTTGETGLIERTSSTTYQITNAVVDVPSVPVVTSAGDTDEILIFNPSSGIIKTITIDNFLKIERTFVKVVNNTGVTINKGKVINIAGFDGTSDALEIALAKADTIENTEVLGLTTTDILDGTTGLVNVFGRVTDLDTSSFTEGEIVYLSASVAGGLTTTRPAIPIQMGHIGKVDASTGFIQVEIRELERSIFGGFSHTLDQTFTVGVSKAIAFNKNDQLSGIDHSETVDNEEFTFTSGGVYQATAEPQYTRTSGGGTDILNIFLSLDTGSGFVIVPDSNIKAGVNAAGVTNVSTLTKTFRVTAGDKIKFMVQVENSNLILDAFPASGTAPNEIPLTPSIIMNIIRIGD